MITFNEEANIGDCLSSVDFCDQRVVIDSGSGDRTREIARAAGAAVHEHAFMGYARQKNWAIDAVAWHNPWLLFVDADERVTPTLSHSLERVVTSGDAADAYYVDRQFRFLGHAFNYSGLAPNWHLRLIRTHLARFEERELDERLLPPARVGRLRGTLLHDDKRGLAAWIDRHNRYSDTDARMRRERLWNTGFEVSLKAALSDAALRRRWLKTVWWAHIPMKPAVIFAYMYLFRLGFLDGRAGWQYAWLRAYYELITELKRDELARTAKPSRVGDEL